MWNAGKLLICHYIITVYQQYQEYPIKLAPKTSDQHIYLSSSSVMCVKFATQILSWECTKTFWQWKHLKRQGTAACLTLFWFREYQELNRTWKIMKILPSIIYQWKWWTHWLVTKGIFKIFYWVEAKHSKKNRKSCAKFKE